MHEPSPEPSGARIPVFIRHRTLDDIQAIPELMRRVYPPPRFGPESVWSERSLLRHLARFPAGHFVAALEDGRVVGTSTCMRISLAQALAPHTWGGITARGTLATHDPEGAALYGVNIAVDPAVQGLGVGRLLYDARIALARSQGCTHFVAGARIAGYHAHADRLSPQAYLEEVKAGRLFDPTVSKQLKMGFEVRGLLLDYAHDSDTLGHAALIVMVL